MTDYMNEDTPPAIPVRKGGESRPVRVRLVAMDGTEHLVSGRSVRYAANHVMVAVRVPAITTEYLWVRTDDVDYLD